MEKRATGFGNSFFCCHFSVIKVKEVTYEINEWQSPLKWCFINLCPSCVPFSSPFSVILFILTHHFSSSHFPSLFISLCLPLSSDPCHNRSFPFMFSIRSPEFIPSALIAFGCSPLPSVFLSLVWYPFLQDSVYFVLLDLFLLFSLFPLVQPSLRPPQPVTLAVLPTPELKNHESEPKIMKLTPPPPQKTWGLKIIYNVSWFIFWFLNSPCPSPVWQLQCYWLSHSYRGRWFGPLWQELWLGDPSEI